MTTLTALSPAQTDAILSDLYTQQDRLSRTIKRERHSLRPNHLYIDQLLNEKYGVDRDITDYQTRYELAPWSRYFLVTNGNGHIHSSTHCATCFPTTQFAWLTGLSGADFERVIADYGCKVCSVCFPQAPVDPRYSQPGRLDREAQSQKDAEKARRRSAKLEKALLPDGSALKVRVGGCEERVETVVTAERLLVEALLDHHRYTYLRENPRPGFRTDWDQDIEEAGKAAVTLVHALEVKKGVSSDTIWADARQRLARKVKQWEKEGRW